MVELAACLAVFIVVSFVFPLRGYRPPKLRGQGTPPVRREKTPALPPQAAPALPSDALRWRDVMDHLYAWKGDQK